MRTSILMLVWEIWRRNCKYVCLALGTMPCYLLFYWAIHNHVPDRNTLIGYSVPWMFFSLFWVFATFNYTEVNTGKGWTGFPYRLFALPVPTMVLAWLPMILGMVSVVLVYVAWVKLVFLVSLGRVSSLWLWPGGMMAVNLAWFQAIVWSLAGFRAIRTAVLSVAGLICLVGEGATMNFLKNAQESSDYLFWKRVLVLSYLGLAVCAFVGAWFSLARQRRGGGRGRGRLKAQFTGLIERIMDAWPGGKKPFSSSLAAQFWFEWRCGGVLLPVSVGSVLLLLLGPVSWLNSDFHRNEMHPGVAASILLLTLLTPVLLAFAIGKGFAKPDFWSMDLALKPFLAVRPLTSGEMVLTKMKVAALSTVISWLLVLAAIPLWFVLWVDASVMQKFSESEARDWLQAYYSPFARSAIPILLLVAATVLTWRGLVGSLWVGLSGSRRYVFSSAVVHGVVVGGFLVAWVYARVYLAKSQLPTVVDWFGWTLAAAVIVKLWMGLFFWDRVSRQHLGSKLVVSCLLVWVGVTVCLIALAWLICPYVVWLKYLLILGALLGCPLARLGIAPLSLARNRHR